MPHPSAISAHAVLQQVLLSLKKCLVAGQPNSLCAPSMATYVTHALLHVMKPHDMHQERSILK